MNKIAPVEPVSRYALYGESLGADDPEFVHIEDIHTRSSLYDWRIAAHIHQRMFQIVYLLGGPASVQLDSERTDTVGPCAICVPANVVHGFVFSPATLGYVVTVSQDFLLDGRYPDGRQLFELMLAEPRIVRYDGDDTQLDLIRTVLGQMASEFQRLEIGRNEMFDWLFRILLLSIRRRIVAQGEAATEDTDAKGYGRQLFSAACRLIEDHYREHLSIAVPAERMAMSQARLNRLCRVYSGKTMHELLHDRLALEAQRYLIYTSATVEMVAYELGFRDPGYFCRFFKRKIGRSPGEFRQQRQRPDVRTDIPPDTQPSNSSNAAQLRT